MGESIRFRIAGRPIDVPVADAEQLVVDLETIGVLRAVGSPSSAAATIRHAIARVDEQREFQLDREGEFAVLATLEAVWDRDRALPPALEALRHALHDAHPEADDPRRQGTC